MNNIVIIKPRLNNLNLFLMCYFNVFCIYSVDVFLSQKGNIRTEVMVGYDGGRTTTSCIFQKKKQVLEVEYWSLTIATTTINKYY